MELCRKGEAGPTPFRSGRFFVVDSKWFFASREGIDQGPFETKAEAENGLAEFLKQVITVERRLSS